MKVFSQRKCARCRNPFTPSNGSHRYCGSKLKRTGCSYLNSLAYYKKANREPRRKAQIARLGYEWKIQQRLKKTAYAARQRVASRAWQSRNKAAVIAAGRKWRAANLPKILFANQQRRTLKQTTGRVTYVQWTEIKKRFKNCCAKCGTPESSLAVIWAGTQFIRLTMDHIFPISKGGKHLPENIQPLCVSCNSRKRDRV